MWCMLLSCLLRNGVSYELGQHLPVLYLLDLILVFPRDFPLFFSVFINIHEYQNYANMITCIFDQIMKDLCLSFHLEQILVIYA